MNMLVENIKFAFIGGVFDARYGSKDHKHGPKRKRNN